MSIINAATSGGKYLQDLFNNNSDAVNVNPLDIRVEYFYSETYDYDLQTWFITDEYCSYAMFSFDTTYITQTPNSATITLDFSTYNLNTFNLYTSTRPTVGTNLAINDVDYINFNTIYATFSDFNTPSNNGVKTITLPNEALVAMNNTNNFSLAVGIIGINPENNSSGYFEYNLYSILKFSNGYPFLTIDGGIAGYLHNVNGVSASSILKVDGTVRASISKINGV